MKKIFFFAAFISLVAAAACTKDPVDSPSMVEGTGWEEGAVSLTFSATTDRTKVSGMVGESNVSSLQIFVFDETKLEAEGYSSTGNAVDIKCFPGKKEAVAIANYDEIDWHNITSIEDLEQITSNLEDNSVGKFVMFGQQSLTVESTKSGTSSTNSYNERIEVTRLVARVGIQKITNSSEGFYAGTLTVKSIYLINVAGIAVLYSPYTDYSPKVWLNKSAYQTNVCDALLNSGTLNISVPSSSSKDINQYFYCYPNPTADDTSIDSFVGDWVERYTRLVVEADLKGESWYYPVSFSGIKSNHTYTVTDLTITGPGASNPDDGPRSTTGNATVLPGDWNLGDVEVAPKF